MFVVFYSSTWEQWIIVEVKSCKKLYKNDEFRKISLLFENIESRSYWSDEPDTSWVTMRRLLVLFYRLTLKSEEILQVKSSKSLSIIQLLNAVHAMQTILRSKSNIICLPNFWTNVIFSLNYFLHWKIVYYCLWL